VVEAPVVLQEMAVQAAVADAQRLILQGVVPGQPIKDMERKKHTLRAQHLLPVEQVAVVRVVLEDQQTAGLRVHPHQITFILIQEAGVLVYEPIFCKEQHRQTGHILAAVAAAVLLMPTKESVWEVWAVAAMAQGRVALPPLLSLPPLLELSTRAVVVVVV
jgi:hypothetical protein